MRDAIPLHFDDRVLNHEGSHGLQAWVEGFDLCAILADRHSLLDDHGTTVYILPEDASLEARCRVVIAGNVEGSVFSWTDQREAMKLWAAAGSPPRWLDAREAEVRKTLRDHRHAFTRLVNAMAERGGNISGVEAEEIVRGQGR